MLSDFAHEYGPMWYSASLFLMLAVIEVVVGAADDALEVLSCGDILDVLGVESVPIVSIGQRLHSLSLGDQYTSTYRRL